MSCREKPASRTDRMSGESTMSVLNRHLETIASAISVSNETTKYLQQDFAIISDYLRDLLSKCGAFAQMLTYTGILGGHINCAIIVDMSKLITLRSRFQNGLYIRFLRNAVTQPTWLAATPFAKNQNTLPGDELMTYVRTLILQGLQANGCFVRGHKGDIYELELDPRNKLQCITLNASTDMHMLCLHMRVLMKWPHSPHMGPEPHPRFSLKTPWLAMAQTRGVDFSICTPLAELEMQKNSAFCMGYRFVCLLLRQKANLSSLQEDHVMSACYDRLFTKVSVAKADEYKIIDIIFQVIKRMIHCMEIRNFPYYWNTRGDLINILPNSFSAVILRQALRRVLDDIKTMDKNKNLTLEEVANYFGICINPNVMHVDKFGMYKSFESNICIQ